MSRPARMSAGGGLFLTILLALTPGGCATRPSVRTWSNPSVTIIQFPVSASFMYKLAWYVDELDGARFASHPEHGLKARFARIGVDTNGIWDVTLNYRNDSPSMLIRGTGIPRPQVERAMDFIERSVSEAYLDEYVATACDLLSEESVPETKRPVRWEYDPETGTGGYVRRSPERTPVHDRDDQRDQVDPDGPDP